MVFRPRLKSAVHLKRRAMDQRTSRSQLHIPESTSTCKMSRTGRCSTKFAGRLIWFGKLRRSVCLSHPEPRHAERNESRPWPRLESRRPAAELAAGEELSVELVGRSLVSGVAVVR